MTLFWVSQRDSGSSLSLSLGCFTSWWTLSLVRQEKYLIQSTSHTRKGVGGRFALKFFERDLATVKPSWASRRDVLIGQLPKCRICTPWLALVKPGTVCNGPTNA